MNGLPRAQTKMAEAGVPQQAIDVFSDFYRQLGEESSGTIAEADVEPLTAPDRAADFVVDDAAVAAASATAVIKLNGGLGTSMGMDRAKSLLPVSGDRTFLDIIVGQVRSTRDELGIELPLLFMNSFRTREDTLKALEAYPDLAVGGLPLDFQQHLEPKLRADDLTPVEHPADPSLEWCPPGHGDLYTALQTSGVLAGLLDAGYRYASISNADNLGAAPDPAMMGWFARSGAPYAAEVCRRTPADVKGGHLVRRVRDGRLVLRETAQIAAADAEAAADLERHAYFHTNNLWFDLRQLAATLDARGGVLGLPLIRNDKRVDPSDPGSTKVVQIESAMGAAVEVFDGAVAIEVDRSRFLPVKTTNDLVLLRSDVYRIGTDSRVRAEVEAPARVDLDRAYYTTIGDLETRIPHPLSLIAASSLRVAGDWTFGADVAVRGDVVLDDDGTARTVAAGARLG